MTDGDSSGQGDVGLVEIGYGCGLFVAVPDGYSYNEGWVCWSNADYTVSLHLEGAQTYSSSGEMESAMSGKTAKIEDIGSYTVHLVEDPDSFNGPTTWYYIELAGVGGYAGCRIAVNARDSGTMADTQAQDIKDMIASISAM